MPADAAPAESPTPVTVVTATWLETWIARLVLRHTVPVTQVGVGATWQSDRLFGPLIVCGLAGGLAPALRPGALVIPSWVGTAASERFACDPTLTDRLRQAARKAGHKAEAGPVMAASRLVTGAERHRWASEGFVAVEMESGELLGRGHQVAVVRVILDTPERELSSTWEHPWNALRRPGVWLETLRLAVDAPRASYRAAGIVKRAMAE